MNLRYLVPQNRWRVEWKVKGSLFIASGGQITSSNEAKIFVATIRKKFYDARHHCFAYVAGYPGSYVDNGMSDDGEPKGTAGNPMLNILLHSSIGEIIVVVTRYFGGTKLGTGGLVRAYSKVVKLLLETIPLKEKFNGMIISIIIGYENIKSLNQLIIKNDGKILNEEYFDKVQLDVMLLPSAIDKFKVCATELTNGKIKFKDYRL